MGGEDDGRGWEERIMGGAGREGARGGDGRMLGGA